MWRNQEMKSELAALHNRYAWVIVYPILLFVLVRSCGGGGGGSIATDAARTDAITGFATSAVSAYVSASAANTASVEAIYGKLVKPESEKVSFPFPEETILGVYAETPQRKATRKDHSEVWLAPVRIVADDGIQTWQQYVTITDDNAVGVIGLPGRVPGPKTLAATAENVSGSGSGAGVLQVESNSAVYAAVRDFGLAWLDGDGDISRFAQPGIPVFATPPCSTPADLLISSIQATGDPKEISGNVTVATTMKCVSAGTTKLHYNLLLTGIGGRWVISDIAAPPPTP